MLVEPRQSAAQHIRAVLGLVKCMALAGIDNQFRANAKGLQSMPELERLRRWTLRIPLAHDDQRRRLHLLDKCNRRALRIHRRIVIYRSAEIRNHPLIDEVLAVVTLPVGKPRARDGSSEPVCLRDGPHRHESAITPSGDADALVVNAYLLQ